MCRIMVLDFKRQETLSVLVRYERRRRALANRCWGPVCAIQALSIVSELSQLNTGMRDCPMPTGSCVVLKSQELSCGKQVAWWLRDAVRDTCSPLADLHLLTCLEKLCNQIEQKHGGECVKVAQALQSRTVRMMIRWVSHLKRRDPTESVDSSQMPAVMIINFEDTLLEKTDTKKRIPQQTIRLANRQQMGSETL